MSSRYVRRNSKAISVSVAAAAAWVVVVGGLFSTSLSARENAQPQPSVEDQLRFKAGDEKGNEIKALEGELLISQSDNKAMEQLNKLLRKYRGSPLEPSLLFRQAELFMRKAKTATFFEVHRDEANVVRFSPLATKSASSRGWITRAANTYDSIEHRFPTFRDMDLVLFNDGFARQELNQNKVAMEKYRRVIENFSESPLVPDCHLSIGEMLFNDKKFQAAFDEFQKIRETPEARVYPYGLYKGAWALYNLHRTADGLKQLEEVVAYSKQPAEEGSNRLDLTREALDDMVVFYEDVKSPEDAVSYFRNQGGDDRAGDLVLKLGKMYQRHGRFKNLETVYTDLIGAVPMAAERPEMHKDLMDGFEATKQRDKVIAQLEALSDLCQDQGAWSKGQSADSKKNCWTTLEETGKRYASKWHKELKKNPNQNLENLTARAYESLLKNGQKISGEDKVRFDYAELLFQRNDFRKASVQYSKVAHLTKDAKLRQDSSYGALVALQKAAGDKWSDADELQFGHLADDYVTMNPRGAYVLDVKFQKAFIAYEKNHYDVAEPQFKDLALHNFSTPKGLKAAQLYLDVLNLQKKYERLRDDSQMFLVRFGAHANADTKALFRKIHQQAAFTVVQGLEASGKYGEAVQGYLKFLKEDPSSDLADKALYNAIRCANLSGDLQSAAKMSEQLISQYPKSAYRNELAHSLVTLYEAQAQLGRAADTLVRLAAWEPSKANTYLLSGADYKAFNNEWSQAVKIYTQLSQKSPNTPEGRESLQRLEALAEKKNQWDKATKLLKQIAESHEQPQASIANTKLVQRAFDLKNDDEAFRLAKKTVSMRNEKNVSVWALAQSRMIQGEILEKEFDQASVKARPDRLTMVIGIKTEKLEKTQKAYQDAIAFGDRPTAIAAMVRMAECYGKYSAALNQIQPPADSSDADKQKFVETIENMTMPIEEKDAETLNVALKQAKALHLYDGTVATIQAELNRLSRRNVKGKAAMEIATPENVIPVVD